MKFRIYYGDGSAYSGETTEDAFKAPTVDGQVVVQQHPESTGGYYLCHETGYYVWVDDSMWQAVDKIGYVDYLMRQGIPKYVVFGRSMGSTEAFERLLRRAVEEAKAGLV